MRIIHYFTFFYLIKSNQLTETENIVKTYPSNLVECCSSWGFCGNKVEHCGIYCVSGPCYKNQNLKKRQITMPSTNVTFTEVPQNSSNIDPSSANSTFLTPSDTAIPSSNPALEWPQTFPIGGLPTIIKLPDEGSPEFYRAQLNNYTKAGCDDTLTKLQVYLNSSMACKINENFPTFKALYLSAVAGTDADGGFFNPSSNLTALKESFWNLLRPSCTDPNCAFGLSSFTNEILTNCRLYTALSTTIYLTADFMNNPRENALCQNYNPALEIFA
ncbi:hypothetical protein HK099_006516 [Clydaea vesicula]|uniref:Chitin-binding type-1 domain-containing protein n=1 Tax=Clydaea vesicula TaxID=447962 RepID=A0AAD5TXQ9_9FUNG|nr:hypothetical protein HK099_006516 [Clydaea vesicula]